MNDKARGFLLLDHTICLLFLLQRLFKPFSFPLMGLDAKQSHWMQNCYTQKKQALCHDSLSIGSFATTTK